jgi:hypothetical protein
MLARAISLACPVVSALSWRLQVWQNVLQLWEYQEAQITDTAGRTKMVFQPMKPFVLDRNAGAAIFVKYGFDRDVRHPRQQGVPPVHAPSTQSCPRGQGCMA